MYKLIYFKLFVSTIARTYMDRAIYINEVNNNTYDICGIWCKHICKEKMKYNKIILDATKNKYTYMHKNMYRSLNDTGRVSALKV